MPDLTPKQMSLRDRLQRARAALRSAQDRVGRLEALCSAHQFEKCGSFAAVARCAVCDFHGGWWCPDSPTHQCVYSRDFDYCDYCGGPEERK